LHEWYAVCGGFATACGGASEDVAVLEGERERLLLDPGRTRKAEVCEGTEDKGGEEIRKRCECLRLGLLGLRLGLRLSHVLFCLASSQNSKMKNHGKLARDAPFP
jgi:hypothetical protein